jgi:hypothetical protein
MDSTTAGEMLGALQANPPRKGHAPFPERSG